ncbi:MAG: HAD-IA family hydrolase [Patescibacteria group bacterium]
MNTYNKKNLIFDFDGTLVDSLDLLIQIYNQVHHKYGCLPINLENREELKKLSSKELLKIHKISFFKIPFLLIDIKQKFKKRISEIKIFDDIDFVLRELINRGFNLYILTSNSKQNVEIFLKNNNLLNIFNSVFSSSSAYGKYRGTKRFLKNENINKEDCIYIGDETRDIEAMKKVGMSIISVSWGFNSKEALSELKPDEIIDNPRDLLRFF